VLGWTEAEWLTRRNQPPPTEFSGRFAPLLARRGRREPLAYLLGEREFYGRPFEVTPDVLIPRPESELIIDEALAVLRARAEDGAAAGRHAPPTVLDVGTGSGCLAVTIALECPAARVVAADVAAGALDVARANARRHGVGDRIAFERGDGLGSSARYDLIVANPPYVPERDRATLAPEVARYEPSGALFAGADGLDVVRALLPRMAVALAAGGRLVMEFGWRQDRAVAALIEQTPGLAVRHIQPDLQGIPRVAVAARIG